MRRSQHSDDMHEYWITSEGVVIGSPMRGFSRPDQRHPRALADDSGQNEPELRADDAPATKKESLPRPRKRGKRGRKKQ